MQERQSASDHPRSDDVKGRERHDGDDERGVGDRGDFGDQGIDQTAAHANPQNQGAAATAAGGSSPDTTPPGSDTPGGLRRPARGRSTGILGGRSTGAGHILYSGGFGRTARPKVDALTPARHAYQATTAVTRPR
ncbi:hypothetical protein SAMN06272737_12128 [Blastococcus mobilis]|uniref:Uncharacterized protein n=1 Tax=Blastococcus mobilis TaxID=1938746 RepID=A0A238YLV3_9ACTN|nr:hypothetical protein SAMN06272737_12128 [Blastococcus mobilis]